MMKKFNLSLVLFCISLSAFVADAQSAKFDLVTYTTPTGWTVEKDSNSVTFTTGTDSEFCAVTITRSIESNGDPAKNFDYLWKILAAEGLNAGKPLRGSGGEKGGWSAEVGVSSFEKDGLKGAALMTVFTGNGRAVAIFAITNSEAYQAKIESFIDSVSLPTIATQKAPAAATPVAANPGDLEKLIGRWQRSSSTSPTYADAASWGTTGYTKSRYEFNADGTYVYTERSFSYSYQNIIIVRENGKFSLSGNILSITPTKSSVSAYKKAGGADALGDLVSTKNRPLEKVDYRLTFHYFSGIKEWNLVLQADSPTERDGQFSSLTVFNNAWYFDQKFTNNDLTAARVN